MKVRKFTAKSSRDALRKVREDLGPDAVILANRMVRGGVEILAMPAAEMAAHQAESAQQRLREAAVEPIEMGEQDVVEARVPRRTSGAPMAAALPPAAPSPLAEFLGDPPPRRPFVRQRLDASERSERAMESPRREPIRREREPALEPAPAPAVLRRRTAASEPARAVDAALPPVLRHSGFRPAAAAVPAVAPAASASPVSPAELDALAGAHDPLMAALAREVRSLGGMLDQVRQAGTLPPAPASVLASAPPAPPAVHIEARETGGDGRLAGDAGGRATVPGEEWVRSVMGELRTMRLMIEDQMGAAAFGESARLSPGKGRIARQLSAAGFSSPLIRKLSTRLPEEVTEQEAQAFVHHALVSNLSVAGSEAELLDQGGVFALVGPTGAGKTTTAAKLAARFVVRHGAENLALLTTDGYRIGGQEQLRIYGKILGVAVYAVKDAEDLKRTLAELKNRKLVLIDTVGLSQRDRMVNEQHDLFAHCGAHVKRLLLLNATCHGETLNDVVRAYKGNGLAGCIFSKLDEAVTLGAALDTAIRHRLRVFYAADGQRVPEDLHLANASRLVDVALQRAPGQPAYGAVDLDFPLDLPGAPAGIVASAPAAPAGLQQEVAHG